jgi:hypothetical protein
LKEQSNIPSCRSRFFNTNQRVSCAKSTLLLMFSLASFLACKTRASQSNPDALRSDPVGLRSDGVYLAVDSDFPESLLVVGCYDEDIGAAQKRATLNSRIFLNEFGKLIPKNDRPNDLNRLGFSGKCTLLWGEPEQAQSLSASKEMVKQIQEKKQKRDEVATKVAHLSLSSSSDVLPFLALSYAPIAAVASPVAPIIFALGVVHFGVNLKRLHYSLEDLTKQHQKWRIVRDSALFFEGLSTAARCSERALSEANPNYTAVGTPPLVGCPLLERQLLVEAAEKLIAAKAKPDSTSFRAASAAYNSVLVQMFNRLNLEATFNNQGFYYRDIFFESLRHLEGESQQAMKVFVEKSTEEKPKTEAFSKIKLKD